MKGPRWRRLVRLSLAATAAAACADGTVTAPENVGAGAGHLTVVMQRAGGPAVGGSWLAGLAEVGMGRIEASDVASLRITITDIQFLPVDDGQMGDGMNEHGWRSLSVEPVELDLMALPVEGEVPLVLASGMVDAGDFRMARLFVSDAIIVLEEPVTVGNTTYDAGEPGHSVTIPSGLQTGLKTDFDVNVTVDGDTEVLLVFDPDATFKNVTATGNGKIMLAPVLRSRPMP